MNPYPKPTLELITCPLNTRGALTTAQNRATQIGRNFRAPHHTVSVPGILGELAISAGGVLYLDEPEGLSHTVANHLKDCVKRMHPDFRPVVILAIRAPAPHVTTRLNCLEAKFRRLGKLFDGWDIAGHWAAPYHRGRTKSAG